MHHDDDYEPSDLVDNTTGLVFAGLGIAALIVFCVAAAWLTRCSLGRSPGDEPGAPGMVQPGGAPMPSDELTELRLATEASWEVRARAWEWVDHEARIARIPVARAAEILIRRGFPTRPAPTGGAR